MNFLTVLQFTIFITKDVPKKCEVLKGVPLGNMNKKIEMSKDRKINKVCII